MLTEVGGHRLRVDALRLLHGAFRVVLRTALLAGIALLLRLLLLLAVIVVVVGLLGRLPGALRIQLLVGLNLLLRLLLLLSLLLLADTLLK